MIVAVLTEEQLAKPRTILGQAVELSIGLSVGRSWEPKVSLFPSKDEEVTQ